MNTFFNRDFLECLQLDIRSLLLFSVNISGLQIIKYFSHKHKLHLLLILEYEEVKPWSQGWLIAAGAYPGFCSMERLKVFLLPLHGMLVHRRSLPRNFARFPQQFAVTGTHLYTWVERGTVRVKCLVQSNVPSQGSNWDRSLWSQAH